MSCLIFLCIFLRVLQTQTWKKNLTKSDQMKENTICELDKKHQSAKQRTPDNLSLQSFQILLKSFCNIKSIMKTEYNNSFKHLSQRFIFKKQMTSRNQRHGQKKEQMVDQNFANNTLFMTLSDIEAIQQKYLHSSPKPKQFGMYDPVDYSHREVDVLKEQLRLKLFLTNTSMQCFRQEYGTGQYRLPQSFNEEMVFNRLNNFQRTFQQKQDEDCFQMCEDLKRMMQGQNSGFYFETKQFKTAPAVSQKENTMGLINASTRMREEQAQFEGKYRDGMQAHEIEFKHNQQFQNTPTVQNNTIQFENGIYKGSILGNVPHGPGIFESQSGVLTGTWTNGKLEGQYFFSSRTGQTYKYFYKNNNLVRRELIQNRNTPNKANEDQNKHNPELSQMQNQKGDVKCEGQVLNTNTNTNPNQQQIQKNHNNQNQQQNNPTLTKIPWHNGQYYGELLENLPHGTGKFWNHMGMLIGQWNHGILSGECIFRNKNNQVYKQIYENDQLKSSVLVQKGNQINTLPNIQPNNQKQPKTWFKSVIDYVFS